MISKSDLYTEKKRGDQGRGGIELICLGKLSHEMVDCAWRKFDFSIPIFSSLPAV